MHNERNLTHASFPFSISINALSRNILDHVGNLALARFSSITNALPTIAFHYEGKVVHASFFFSTSTSALLTTTLHHEGKPAYDSFPCNIRTSALLEIVLHREGNLTHARFACMMKDNTTISALPTTTLHHEGKMACAIFIYRTSAFPKTTLHCKGNLTFSCFLYVTSTNTFPRNKFHHEES